jgi:hypothetical protein
MTDAAIVGRIMDLEAALAASRVEAAGLAAELARAAIELREANDALVNEINAHAITKLAHKRDRKLLAAAYGRSPEGRFG